MYIPLKFLVVLFFSLALSGCFVDVSVTGKGQVTSDVGGITCDENQQTKCSVDFLPAEPQAVRFTATPTSSGGWRFKEWSSIQTWNNNAAGMCDGSADPVCDLVIIAEADQTDPSIRLSLTAIFEPSAITFSSPLDGAVFTSSELVYPTATAIDPATGSNLSASIEFRSNIDGLIQAGDTLTPGTHKITASVETTGHGREEKSTNVLVVSNTAAWDANELPKSPAGVRAPTAGSWDGRLQFGRKTECAPSRFTDSATPKLAAANKCPGAHPIVTWDVWVFRPEAVSEAQAPAIMNDSFSKPPQAFDFDPFRVLDENDEWKVFPSPSNTDFRGDIAVYPDPNFPQNPYRSDESGAANPEGSYETYQIKVLSWFRCADQRGLVYSEGAHHCDNSDLSPVGGYFALIPKPLQIVVSNPRTASAAIHSRGYVGIETTDTAITLFDSSVEPQPFVGIEPSVSLDGRLLVWQGPHPVKNANNKTVNGGRVVYSFNANEGVGTGWSAMQPISNMYFQHGAGAPSETLVGENSVPFSQLYPLAAAPLKSPDGVIFDNGEQFPGAYPWISLDATELYFTAVANFQGARRSGASMVGPLTNWTVQMIDGPMNLARGDVKRDVVKDAGVKRDELEAVYNDTLGYRSVLRQLVANIGLSSTMWDFNVNSNASILPRSNREFTYMLGSLFSKDYLEVPLDSVADGQYLIRWPMNELLGYDRNKINEEYSTQPSTVNWAGIKKQSVQHDPTGTADISGNHWNGSLSEYALFPFEFGNADDLWVGGSKGSVNSSVALADITEGIYGNSILFLLGGKVTSAPIDQLPAADQANVTDQLQELVDNQSFTVDAWIWPNSLTEAVTFVDVSGLAELVRHGDGTVSATVRGTADTTLSTPVGLALNQEWLHVALRVKTGRVSIFVNGQSVVETPLLHPVSVNTETPDLTVSVGALDSDNLHGLRVDEFAFSNVGRSVQEIRQSALLRDELDVATSFQGVSVPAVYAGLPQGVSDVQYDQVNISAAMALGDTLFDDPILSSDPGISCASCHQEANFFADTSQFSTGVGGPTARNTPSLVNRLFGTQHMMDGRAGSLEEQVLIPIENPMEMNQSVETTVSRLTNNATYSSEFMSVFSEAPNRDNLAFALASYLRSIVIDPVQPAANHPGRIVFEGKGRCISCHGGPNFSDEKFHNIGLFSSDPGLMGFTGRSADRGKFRTPSLWGISSTAPYFHDGSQNDLAAVVDFYNRGGDVRSNQDFRIKPLDLSFQERSDLVNYLQSLTGTLLN